MPEREGQILSAEQCRRGDIVEILPRRNEVAPFTARIRAIESLLQIGNAVVRLAISPWMKSERPDIPRAIGGGTQVRVVKETKRRDRRHRE